MTESGYDLSDPKHPDYGRAAHIHEHEVVCADCNRPEALVCPGTLDGHHSFEREEAR